MQDRGRLGVLLVAPALAAVLVLFVYPLGYSLVPRSRPRAAALPSAISLLGENPWAVALLRWLYRWPLFIPFVVAAQCMRTFLAKNGLMNNSLVALGILEVDQTVGSLDWRGIIITFVWKQTPFVALLVAGAMASLDRSTIEAARNLGASRLRILFEILVPQVMPALMVGLILSFVTMMSVLSRCR